MSRYQVKGSMKLIHPYTELSFINNEIGYGVVATRLIPAGTITWVKDKLDQTLSPAEYKRMQHVYREILDKYTYIDNYGNYILCWDHGRYVNHSCDPSCMSTGYGFELAARDIYPGEELTDDYGMFNIEYNFECRCGSADCRRIIHQDDLLKYADKWDALVADIFPLIREVEQPLWPLLEEKREVEMSLSKKTPIPSCRLLYYAPDMALR